MDNLIHLLNHNSNFAIVTNTTTKQRQVIAIKSLTPGGIIGPSDGLPAEYVLDPVQILKCSDVAQKVLGIGGDSGRCSSDKDEQQLIDIEKMAFWIALAMTGKEAEERQQFAETKKRKHTDTLSDQSTTTAPTQQQVHDAYLLSLPKEGPDPCCWSKEERDTLLKGTPLSTQINTTLKQIEEEYNRVAKTTVDEDIKLPPFSIKGQGIFPSVLWARSMHISRSFPCSLIDEEGVWWQGRKKYQPPSSSESETIETEKEIGNTTLGDSTTVLSVRLGGYRAPVITTASTEQQDQTDESKPQPRISNEPISIPKQHTPGSSLGILIPLMDMIDHKNAHPVQWESVYNSTTQIRSIRFRSCVEVKEGDELYNNYGPKGNLELLATYGFSISNNVLDSVEGIVLGISIPNQNDEQETLRYQAQLVLVKEYDMPHRIDKDKDEFGVLFLGPFSLHRKLPSSTDETNEDKTADDSDEGGVIPDELYRALSIIGLDNVEEGPMVSIDEMEILKEVLTKKLEGFGTDSSGKRSSSDISSSDQLVRVESVEAYKNGQRELLHLALAELDSLMLGGAGEDDT